MRQFYCEVDGFSLIGGFSPIGGFPLLPYRTPFPPKTMLLLRYHADFL